MSISFQDQNIAMVLKKKRKRKKVNSKTVKGKAFFLCIRGV